MKPFSARTLLERALPFLALGMLAIGAWLGLSWAPPDREMGDVQRIMYAHVPAVWMALVAMTINLIASAGYLATSSFRWDALAEAAAELGVLFGTIGVTLGSIWGRPTWGVWWTWDPRLTTAAIMLVAYAGYLALRRFVDDAPRRAAYSAAVAIVAYADIPIVWFSVRWWRSLHQIQSSPKTVDPQMTLALRWNAFAFLAVLAYFLLSRYRLALADRSRETAPPPEGAIR